MISRGTTNHAERQSASRDFAIVPQDDADVYEVTAWLGIPHDRQLDEHSEVA